MKHDTKVGWKTLTGETGKGFVLADGDDIGKPGHSLVAVEEKNEVRQEVKVVIWCTDTWLTDLTPKPTEKQLKAEQEAQAAKAQADAEAAEKLAAEEAAKKQNASGDLQPPPAQSDEEASKVVPAKKKAAAKAVTPETDSG